MNKRKIMIFLAGLLGAVYLVNPTAGVIELIPDNFPIIGNLDEATATVLLVSALKEFGWDLTFWRPKTKLNKETDIKEKHP
jgi:uncharacterized membrane protein YkvA (DUF1232 family)